MEETNIILGLYEWLTAHTLDYYAVLTLWLCSDREQSRTPRVFKKRLLKDALPQSVQMLCPPERPKPISSHPENSRPVPDCFSGHPDGWESGPGSLSCGKTSQRMAVFLWFAEVRGQPQAPCHMCTFGQAYDKWSGTTPRLLHQACLIRSYLHFNNVE